VKIFLYGTGLALRHPNFAYLGTLLGLLQAGTLYLYAKSLMYRDFRLRWQHAVHTLLFWVVTAIVLVEYYLQPVEVKLQILQQRDHPGVLTSPLLAVAIHLVFLGYLYATIRTINRFRSDRLLEHPLSRPASGHRRGSTSGTTGIEPATD
jgi:hypothetical protein